MSQGNTRASRGASDARRRGGPAPEFAPANEDAGGTLQRRRRGPQQLSHFDEKGAAHMVEVGAKAETAREAVASGIVHVAAATARLIRAGKLGKGDVLGVARLAGIQGAKRASEWIPLCHPLRLTGVDLDLQVAGSAVHITATVRAFDRSGVEMEALAAVAAAALTVYDMCKAVDRGMVLGEIRLERKAGGKSGTWVRTPLRRSARRPAKRR